jgi:hypothetical protein
VTRDDLIVLAPWIVVGAAVGAICAWLFTARSRARRRSTPQPSQRPRPAGRDPDGHQAAHSQGNGAENDVPGAGCPGATS